jgi:hypothetical protein
MRPCLGVVGDAGKAPAQLDCGSELATLLEGGTDCRSLFLGWRQELCVAVRHKRTNWQRYVGIARQPGDFNIISQPETSDGWGRQSASICQSAAP